LKILLKSGQSIFGTIVWGKCAFQFRISFFERRSYFYGGSRYFHFQSRFPQGEPFCIFWSRFLEEMSGCRIYVKYIKFVIPIIIYTNNKFDILLLKIQNMFWTKFIHFISFIFIINIRIKNKKENNIYVLVTGR